MKEIKNSEIIIIRGKRYKVMSPIGKDAFLKRVYRRVKE